MTDLTFIENNISKNTPKNKSKLETAKKLTHLYLNDKFLPSIGNLSACENLQVLYLHNNDITKIRHLTSLCTLKHLYLQKNKINKIEGLQNLKQLKKLYIGYNEISVIEGLENLISLEELHVEKQRLDKVDSLCFDPRSIISLAGTLQILNISNNNITSISGLEPLKLLKTVNASYNKLINIEEVVNVIQNWFYLTEVNFIGNPITKQYRYKDTLIANTFRLVILDDKDINETQRSFIKRFEQEKAQLQQRRIESKMNVPSNLPGKLPPTLANHIKQSLAKNFSNTVLSTKMSEHDDKYIPWKALKPSLSETSRVYPPLFAKQQQLKKKPGTAKRVSFKTFPTNL